MSATEDTHMSTGTEGIRRGELQKSLTALEISDPRVDPQRSVSEEPRSSGSIRRRVVSTRSSMVKVDLNIKH